jgi:hypothetical protein
MPTMELLPLYEMLLTTPNESSHAVNEKGMELRDELLVKTHGGDDEELEKTVEPANPWAGASDVSAKSNVLHAAVIEERASATIKACIVLTERCGGKRQIIMKRQKIKVNSQFVPLAAYSLLIGTQLRSPIIPWRGPHASLQFVR